MGQAQPVLDLPKLFKAVYARKMKPERAVQVFREALVKAYGDKGIVDFGRRDVDDEIAPDEVPEEGIATPDALNAPPPDPEDGSERRGVGIGPEKAEELRVRWEGTHISPERPWLEVRRRPDSTRFQIFTDDQTGEPTNNILSMLLDDYGPDAQLWLDSNETHIILSPLSADQGSGFTLIATNETGWPWR